MTETIDGKVDMESFRKAVKELAKPYSGGFFDIYYHGGPGDTAYATTANYYVAATRWEQHEWSDCGGGIEWTSWLKVYYQPKAGGAISSLGLGAAVIRDREDSRKDRTDLWAHDRAYLKADLQNDTIDTGWMNEEGHIVMQKSIRLKK